MRGAALAVSRALPGALLSAARSSGRGVPSSKRRCSPAACAAGPARARRVAARRVPRAARDTGRGGVHDVAAGLALAALWVGALPALAGAAARRALRPRPARPPAAPAWLALRLVGFVLVSPLVEELFVRSFLHRAAEAWPALARLRAAPVGRAQRLAFV